MLVKRTSSIFEETKKSQTNEGPHQNEWIKAQSSEDNLTKKLLKEASRKEEKNEKKKKGRPKKKGQFKSVEAGELLGKFNGVSLGNLKKTKENSLKREENGSKIARINGGNQKEDELSHSNNAGEKSEDPKEAALRKQKQVEPREHQNGGGSKRELRSDMTNSQETPSNNSEGLNRNELESSQEKLRRERNNHEDFSNQPRTEMSEETVDPRNGQSALGNPEIPGEIVKRKRGRPKKVRPVLANNQVINGKASQNRNDDGDLQSKKDDLPEKEEEEAEEEKTGQDSESCKHKLRNRQKKFGDILDTLKKSEIEQERMKKEQKEIMKRKKKKSGIYLARTDGISKFKGRLNHIFYKDAPQNPVSNVFSDSHASYTSLFQNYYTSLTTGIDLNEANDKKANGDLNEIQKEQTTNDKAFELAHEHTIHNIKTEGEIIDSLSSVKSYINCDLRYFNIDHLVDKVGTFDVVMLDPPWRIKGGQQYDSQFMFANNKFKLEYNTMSNDEIMSLRVEKLVKTGFIFLWILANQINVACEMINHWGFELVDIIVWVKLKDSKINLSHGYYFMHSYELCLVGYKSTPGVSLDYRSKISNNIIFAETRKKSQKPDQIYDIIELMFPGSKKIELFARNNNLRPGWFSLGNQLGEQYDSWKNVLECNECSKAISIGMKRFKSRTKPDFDICQRCFETKREPTHKLEEYFQLENNVEEEILHEYHRCNHCGCEPIWGTRFSCLSCDEYDLCEVCFDKNLQDEKFHDFPDHQFQAFEFPILGNGLPAHVSLKCFGCFQKPIIGACFVCSKCPTFAVCQNCFFTKSAQDLSNRSHKPDHSLEMRLEPVNESEINFKCISCNTSKIDGNIYKYFFLSLLTLPFL